MLPKKKKVWSIVYAMQSCKSLRNYQRQFPRTDGEIEAGVGVGGGKLGQGQIAS